MNQLITAIRGRSADEMKFQKAINDLILSNKIKVDKGQSFPIMPDMLKKQNMMQILFLLPALVVYKLDIEYNSTRSKLDIYSEKDII